MAAKEKEQYGEKESQERFEAALRGALNTPHTPLKDKPKVRKAAKKRKPKSLVKARQSEKNSER